MSIDEILHPTDVILGLKADNKAAAIEEVLSQIRGDERVTNWEELREKVFERDAPSLDAAGCGICIAHGRTKAVNGLVMAAGTSPVGFYCPAAKQTTRILFVAGIPTAFDSEYLRIVGAIVRVCRDPDFVQDLLGAPDGAALLEILSEAMERL